MSVEAIGVLILFGLLFGLMFIRVPIAFALGMSSIATALYLKNQLDYLLL